MMTPIDEKKDDKVSEFDLGTQEFWKGYNLVLLDSYFGGSIFGFFVEKCFFFKIS